MTKVYDAGLSEKFKLKKDTALDQQSKSLINNVDYLFVKVDAAAERDAEIARLAQQVAAQSGSPKAP